MSEGVTKELVYFECSKMRARLSTAACQRNREQHKRKAQQFGRETSASIVQKDTQAYGLCRKCKTWEAEQSITLEAKPIHEEAQKTIHVPEPVRQISRNTRISSLFRPAKDEDTIKVESLSVEV